MNTLSTHNALQKIQRSLTFGMRMVLGAILISSLSATAATWNTDLNNQNWGTASNWTSPVAVPNAVDAEAIFDSIITASRNVNINGNFTVGTITFNDNNSYSLRALTPQTLTFDVSSGNASIKVSNAGGVHSLGVGGSPNLTIALADDLDIDSSAPLFSVRGTITGNANLNINSIAGVTRLETLGTSTLTGAINANLGGSAQLRIGIGADGNQEFNNITSLNINSGTVLLASHQELNASANLNLNGGTLNIQNTTQTFQNLTLSQNSSISMGTSSTGALLTFTGTTTYSTGQLTIGGWDGSLWGGGGDRIIFGTSLSSTFLSNVFWSQQGIMGARQLASGEIVPIPEPGSVLGGIGLAALAVAYEIRRRRQKAMLTVQES